MIAWQPRNCWGGGQRERGLVPNSCQTVPRPRWGSYARYPGSGFASVPEACSPLSLLCCSHFPPPPLISPHPAPVSPPLLPPASPLSAPWFLRPCTSFCLSPPTLSPLCSLCLLSSHLSVFLPPALVLLSRTVWKVGEAKLGGGGQSQPLKGWGRVDYYGLSGAIDIRVQAEGGC